MDGQHDRTTSGVTCHHRLWKAYSVQRHRAWHDITLLGLHARLDDVGRGISSTPLDSTHGQQRQAWHVITALGQHTQSAMSGVALHHRPWTVHTVGNVGHGRREWHYITAIGQHIRSNYVGVAFHYLFWEAQTVERHRAWHANITFGQHTVERRRAWHASIAFGQHTRSKDNERDMTSPPLENAYGRTT